MMMVVVVMILMMLNEGALWGSSQPPSPFLLRAPPRHIAWRLHCATAMMIDDDRQTVITSSGNLSANFSLPWLLLIPL